MVVHGFACSNRGAGLERPPLQHQGGHGAEPSCTLVLTVLSCAARRQQQQQQRQRVSASQKQKKESDFKVRFLLACLQGGSRGFLASRESLSLLLLLLPPCSTAQNC